VTSISGLAMTETRPARRTARNMSPSRICGQTARRRCTGQRRGTGCSASQSSRRGRRSGASCLASGLRLWQGARLRLRRTFGWPCETFFSTSISFRTCVQERVKSAEYSSTDHRASRYAPCARGLPSARRRPDESRVSVSGCAARAVTRKGESCGAAAQTGSHLLGDYLVGAGSRDQLSSPLHIQR
jgi:hypothetical protein